MGLMFKHIRIFLRKENTEIQCYLSDMMGVEKYMYMIFLTMDILVLSKLQASNRSVTFKSRQQGALDFLKANQSETES